MSSPAAMKSEPGLGAASDRSMRLLYLIDDDRLTRELLSLIVADAGFDKLTFDSGEAALSHLAAVPEMPLAILIDMQMPGLSGTSLAVSLRQACGPATRLVAMSGSPVSTFSLQSFDGFLLKPFSAKDLRSACHQGVPPSGVEAHGPSAGAVLNGAVYDSLTRSMHPEQVKGLYRMCLHDAATRIAAMRVALAKRDDSAYRRAAHAIKGGCGMVGAVELARLADAMETEGLPAEGSTPLESFVDAAERLRRMLENKASGT